VFLFKNLINAGNTRAVGADSSHLKLHLKQASGGSAINGIAFGEGSLAPNLAAGQPCDILASVVENHFNGQTTLELMVIGIRLH
jgi:single-stranded-DNA-specific exonuclease